MKFHAKQRTVGTLKNLSAPMQENNAQNNKKLLKGAVFLFLFHLSFSF
jgi:hypothetical protein